MNKLAILSILLGSVGTTALGTTAILNNIETRQVNSLYQNKIFEMDFNTNEIKNSVTNKTYSTVYGKGKLVNSIKGKGFQTNSDLIRIPGSDLKIPTSTEYVTVSAQYKYGGTDTTQMIFAFGLYDLYFNAGWIGFNTAQGDIYGTPITLPTTDYVTITAVFSKSDITKCKLYINGVKQNLRYKDSSVAKMRTNPFSSDFYISSWEQYTTPQYLADGNNIIDEVMIFTSNITDSEADKLALAHRMPELSVKQESNYLQANWATEILESDLIYNYDFEEGSYVPLMTWSTNAIGDITGGQKLTTEQSYSGVRSAYTPKTTGGLGNHYNFPDTQSNKNIMRFDRAKIPNGTKLSVSFNSKNVIGNNFLNAIGEGAWSDSIIKLTPTLVETAPIGSTKIKINTISGLYLGQYITSERTTIYNGEFCRQIMSMTKNSDGTYTLTLNNGFEHEQKAGDNLHTRTWRTAWNFDGKYHDNKEWGLHNLNTEVTNFSDYNVNDRGSMFYINTINEGLSYIDDLKFGYATQVKLYRNDNLIYQGYESQYNDTTAKDTTAPIMSDVSINTVYEGTNRKITMSFPTVKDIGNTYNYTIQSIGRSGKETFLTEDKPITITSGLKGYSYIIDKVSTTNPSNTVNLSASATSINHSIPSSDTGKYYLHIKAIDNEGNVGQTKHILIDTPTLTAKANPSSNNIRLDWTMNDINNKTFKVYQKKPGGSTYQSVSATDLSKSKQVRVLNIYPTASTIPKLPNFYTWDGETVTNLPKSASLKQWMESSNNENEKGYGKGLIEVKPISFEEFNSNSTNILKDSNGEWNYDVIVVGTWDNNGNEDANATNLFNSIATSNIINFVNNGKGLLVGHDVINNYVSKKWNLDLLSLLNIDTLSSEVTGDDEVYVNKKGLLVNYPWDITVKNILNIPVTHTSRFFTKGDVWLKYVNALGYSNSPTNLKLVENENGTNNHYLTTWNNVAMIQTGHSNGDATPDEQKILANTIFYLNQLSTDNFLDDYSGQDITAPNKPVINSHSFTEDGFVNLNFNSVQDNGSTYSYYVESVAKSGTATTLSNTVTETITTGIKGYSYEVDSNPSTIPDNTIEQTTNATIKAKTKSNNSDIYVHIKAIDNAGNESETYHYKISDTTKPILTLSLSPSSWTNGVVTINATANDSGSGIKYIILPNGNKVSSTTASYNVAQNGLYYFKAVDYMNNETVSYIKITNIDKIKPTTTITNNQNWTNQNVQVDINSTDN